MQLTHKRKRAVSKVLMVPAIEKGEQMAHHMLLMGLQNSSHFGTSLIKGY